MITHIKQENMTELFLGIPDYTVFGKAKIAVDNFLADIFHKGSKAYNRLSEYEQQVSQWASGVIAMISNNMKLVPDMVFDIVQRQFPSLTKENLQDFLIKGAEFITKGNTIFSGTWQEAITTIQSYLKPYEGNQWKVFAKALVSGIIAAFLPENSIIQNIEMALEYVYHAIVKPKVLVLTPIVATPTAAGPQL